MKNTQIKTGFTKTLMNNKRVQNKMNKILPYNFNALQTTKFIPLKYDLKNINPNTGIILLSNNEMIIKDKLCSIKDNKATIKALNSDNKESYKIIVKLLSSEIKTLKNSSQVYKNASNKILIRLINTRYDSKDKAIQTVLYFMENKINLDYSFSINQLHNIKKLNIKKLISKTFLNDHDKSEIENKIKEINKTIAINKANKLIGDNRAEQAEACNDDKPKPVNLLDININPKSVNKTA